MSSKVKIVTFEELGSMSTFALVGRRTKLLKCEDSFESSDRFGYEEEPNPKETGFVEFKDQPDWINAYNEVKSLLSNREHIPNAAERKARRQQQGKKKY